MSTVAVREGARLRLPEVLSGMGAARALVVASGAAVRRTGIGPLLGGVRTEWFGGFQPNPRLEHVLAASAVRSSLRPDVVVAVGGGSAIDTAKAAACLPPQRHQALAVLAGEEEPGPCTPVIAVPTTAGSGSQATRFAALYVGEQKVSLDHPRVRPCHALVDPELLRGSPRRLVYACAFDALCHGIESYWSRASTPGSRRPALQAVDALVPLLAHDTIWPMDRRIRAVLATAAHDAGQAIDITRTTAAHAFSYALTVRFGIPHGVACLLNLAWLLDCHVERADMGPRLDEVLERLSPLRRSPRTRWSAALGRILRVAGYPEQLSAYSIGEGDLPWIVSSGMGSNRLGNHPVALDAELVTRELKRML